MKGIMKCAAARMSEEVGAKPVWVVRTDTDGRSRKGRLVGKRAKFGEL